MKTRLFLTLCSIGALAVACGPGTRTPEKSSSAPAKASKPSAALAASVYADVSDGAHFSMSVTNNTGKKIELLFPTGQTHDIIVVDAAGREVWKWSNGRMFTTALQTKLLGNRETLRFEERWETPQPGVYTVIARLNSESHPVEHRAEFSIPATTTLASN